jgi:hypothetical protein
MSEISLHFSRLEAMKTMAHAPEPLTSTLRPDVIAGLTAAAVVLPKAMAYAFVNYTTLGYGDLIPVDRWRLLGPMTAMNGVLLFEWSTAVIFEVLRGTLSRPEIGNEH